MLGMTGAVISLLHNLEGFFRPNVTCLSLSGADALLPRHVIVLVDAPNGSYRHFPLCVLKERAVSQPNELKPSFGRRNWSATVGKQRIRDMNQPDPEGHGKGVEHAGLSRTVLADQDVKRASVSRRICGAREIERLLNELLEIPQFQPVNSHSASKYFR